jgi:hypothetical protein
MGALRFHCLMSATTRHRARALRTVAITSRNEREWHRQQRDDQDRSWYPPPHGFVGVYAAGHLDARPIPSELGHRMPVRPRGTRADHARVAGR